MQFEMAQLVCFLLSYAFPSDKPRRSVCPPHCCFSDDYIPNLWTFGNQDWCYHRSARVWVLSAIQNVWIAIVKVSHGKGLNHRNMAAPYLKKKKKELSSELLALFATLQSRCLPIHHTWSAGLFSEMSGLSSSRSRPCWLFRICDVFPLCLLTRWFLCSHTWFVGISSLVEMPESWTRCDCCFQDQS